MIWVNGTQNSGLVNFASESLLPLFCINQYHLPKNDLEGLKLISKKALKKWNTDFRYLEYSVRKNRGAFHSTKTLENLETAANGTEISRKSFLKFRKLLNFRKAKRSNENCRNSGREQSWMKTGKLSGKKKNFKFGHTSQGCPVNNPWYPYRSRYRSFYELAVTYPVHDLNDVCKVDHTHRGNVPYSLRFFWFSAVFFFFCLFSPTTNPGPRLLAREKLL